MKKILIAVVLVCMSFIGANAQSVYNEVYRISRQAADSTQLDLESRKVAMFKVNALKYLSDKSLELMPDSSAYMLDRQAYALYDFVDYYTTRLANAKKNSEKEVVMTVFKNATLNNPRFNDPDHDYVWAYINNTNFITPFSLDTDWEKANAEVHNRKW